MKYVDDKIETIKEDIERLRAKPHMYISYTGSRGALHLADEAAQNAVDEAVSDLSPCDTIELELDENTNRFTVRDNGRGIPFDKVEEICTYLQSGSNLYKEKADKKKAVRKGGEHGVGLTAVNALSDVLTFIIYKDGQKGVFTFLDGHLTDTKITKCSEDKHGTTVSFIPSEKYLKKCPINGDDLRKKLDYKAYLLPSKIVKFNYTRIKKGKEVGITEKLYHKNGIVDMLNGMVKDPMLKPIRITADFSDGDIIDCALTFSEDDMSDFGNHKSFCNYIDTIEDGEHVKAFKFGWCLAVSKLVTDAMTETEKKKYPLQFEDCRQGLCAVINLTCLFPYFTGQTKQCVGNDELYKPIMKAVASGVNKYFKNNPGDLKKVIAIVKRNAKARVEVKKIKKSEFKRMDSFEAATIGGYWPCRYPDSKYSEIFVCEGDSAGTRVTGVRDDRYQAVFKLRGNPLNSYGLSVAQIMENEEMRKFYKIGGAGIKEMFDPRKFRFAKVIMFLDSDIDAYNMCSLFSGTLLWCSPALVEEGRVYRTLAPLYIINDKKHPYLISKAEKFQLYADKIVENVKFVDSNGNQLTDDQAKELIEKNSAYYSEIESLEKYFYVDSEIFEFILSMRGSAKIKNQFERKFTEMGYDEEEGFAAGVYKGNHYSLMVNPNFYEKCKRLQAMISETNNGHIYYSIIDKGEKLPGVYSLGSIFKLTSKYMPEVIERIKGVGELPEEVIWETVLNPKTRKLLRLTIGDLEMELEKVKILHGKDPSLRKKFMEGYLFDKDDLDT